MLICDVSNTKDGKIPNTKLNKRNGSKHINSRRFKSANLDIYIVFNRPKKTRQNKNNAYAAVKTIVVAVKMATNRLTRKRPVKISISAPKVGLKTGKLIFPMVKKSIADASNGIVCANPP